MKYRKFPGTGWKVSEIGLGCWQIGGSWDNVSNEEARLLLKKALDKGINFFDTSDTYGDGRSEKFLGELIKSTSEKIFITTKLGRRIRGTNYLKGYKSLPMEEFVNRSLKYLDIDCIDLLQLHCPPLDQINEIIIQTLDKIVKKGKINYYGISVFNLSEAYEAMKYPNIKSVQLVFNIFRQKPLDDFLKKAKEKNLAVIARGPLASGLLTGTINKNTKFIETDHRNYNRDGRAFNIGDTFSGVDFDKGLQAVEKLKMLLPTNYSLSDLALKWILTHEEITTVIPGAINQSQVEKNAKSTDLNDISELVPKINKIYNEIIRPDIHHKW